MELFALRGKKGFGATSCTARKLRRLSLSLINCELIGVQSTSRPRGSPRRVPAVRFIRARINSEFGCRFALMRTEECIQLSERESVTKG